MRTTSNFLVLLILASPALGHHSVAAFYYPDRTTEIEGVVTEIFWRNPHTGFTIEVVNADGEIEEWVTEGSPTSALVRRGFMRDTVKVGDRVRYTGRASRRGELMIFGGAPSHLLLPNGEEVNLSPNAALDDGRERGSAAEAAGTGIFKVWSFHNSRYQLRNPFVLTPLAQAALDAYDARTDDPSLQCIPPGMPNAILNPYPIELVDEGDRIILRIEEWDQQRVIHMTEEARGRTPEPSHLGYSVGRWDENTLVVDVTRLNFPYLDQDGRPMSENVTMRERFTMNEDETELQYEIVITDPEFLVEPAIWDHTWFFKPGDEILPGFEGDERFECELRDVDDSVYR
ncbi:MAG: DUF6152 family protein [Gammaproteobacteria bacterium]